MKDNFEYFLKRFGKNRSFKFDEMLTEQGQLSLFSQCNIFAKNNLFDDAGSPMHAQGAGFDPICVEDDCWLASSASILAGITIGTRSIVAAGSVFNVDVPSYSVVAGSPARMIQNRS